MPEKININTTIGDFVAMYPQTRKIFDRFDLDYCCGGKKEIKAAAEEKEVNLNELVTELEQNISSVEEKEQEKIWINSSLSEIIDHIVSKHHGFLKKALPDTYKLLERVVRVHGPKHGNFLNKLNDIYSQLKEKLEEHLNDEEKVLFPYIKELESGAKQKSISRDKESLNTVIEILCSEHDEAGNALREMRNITSNYILPHDACESFKALYDNLQEIEDDLHEHVHLENTVLFPKVQALLN